MSAKVQSIVVGDVVEKGLIWWNDGIVTDNAKLSRVRTVAQQILDGLGDRAPDWTVLEVADAADVYRDQDEPDLVLSSNFGGGAGLSLPPPDSDLLVVVGTDDRAQTARAYFASYLPEPQAIAQLASHLQDHATENSTTFGVPLPPCPGHRHPLNADVADGVAVWVCPATSAHQRRPIVT